MKVSKNQGQNNLCTTALIFSMDDQTYGFSNTHLIRNVSVIGATRFFYMDLVFNKLREFFFMNIETILNFVINFPDYLSLRDK